MCGLEGVQTVESVPGFVVPGSGSVVPGLGFRVLSPKFNQSTQNTKQKNTKHETRNFEP